MLVDQFHEKYGISPCHWASKHELDLALQDGAKIVRWWPYDDTHEQAEAEWPDGSRRLMTINLEEIDQWITSALVVGQAGP